MYDVHVHVPPPTVFKHEQGHLHSTFLQKPVLIYVAEMPRRRFEEYFALLDCENFLVELVRLSVSDSVYS